MNKTQRWYHDPKTELPTIRRHPDAREYQTPDAVKRMAAGQEPDEYDYPFEGPCGLCSQPFHPGHSCQGAR